MKQSTLNIDKEGHIQIDKEPQKVVKSMSALWALLLVKAIILFIGYNS